MGAETPLIRVRKFDFFAILGSGVYVMVCWSLVIIGFKSNDSNPSVGDTVLQVSGFIEKHWPIAVAFLFLAFLVGNVIRALRVDVADKCSEKWFRVLHTWIPSAAYRKDYEDALWKTPFPYGAMLEFEISALNENLQELPFRIPPKGTRYSMFNFWKWELCCSNPTAFQATQELEGCVRLFAAMFWAGLVSLLPGFAALFIGEHWRLGAAAMILISALLCCVFGWQLRRVRGQEVAGVFWAYVSLSLGRARDAGHSKQKP